MTGFQLRRRHSNDMEKKDVSILSLVQVIKMVEVRKKRVRHEEDQIVLLFTMTLWEV